VLTPFSARLSSVSAQSETRSYTLIAHTYQQTIRTEPALKTSVIGVNEQFPAPVLRISHGQTLSVDLVNNTTDPIGLDWHGIRQATTPHGQNLLNASPIAPETKGVWRFTPPDSGFYLYRPFVLGKSTPLAARGLTGGLIIEEKNPPVVDHDLCMIVQDWLLDAQNQLQSFERNASGAGGGRLGNVMSVNGQLIPQRQTFAPGTRLRVRLGNGCVSRILRLRFDDLKVFVAAIDGQPTDTFEPLRSTLPFPPGCRYDLLIDLPLEEKKRGFITAMIGNGTPLIAFETQGESLLKKRTALPPIQPLAANALLPPEIKLQNALRTDFTIEGGVKVLPDGKMDVTNLDVARAWRVNGATGDAHSKPLFTAKKGQPVVITLANKTDWAQPIHLHGHVFRLLHPYDDGWEPYWLDTLHMPEQRTLRLAFMADQVGKWMISSSNLERFDAGLWHWFEVV
jgi:FtsP/CotA-like multicopper oxidase with cupredoxin domain